MNIQEWDKCPENSRKHTILLDKLIVHEWNYASYYTERKYCIQLLEGAGSAEEAQALLLQAKELGQNGHVATHQSCSLSRPGGGGYTSYCFYIESHVLDILVTHIERQDPVSQKGAAT